MLRVIGCLLLLAMLLGCDKEDYFGINDIPAREQELLDQLEDLKGQLLELQNKLSDAQDATSDLQLAISHFDDENWRDVVPQVRNAASDIEDALDDLEQGLDEAIATVEE